MLLSASMLRWSASARAWRYFWRQWERWCADRGVQAIPADPLTLCAYLTERAHAGKATGTLDMSCTVTTGPAPDR